MVKWGGYPYFGHFLVVLGISDESGVPDWSPRGCKPAEKTVHHPSGVISEAPERCDRIIFLKITENSHFEPFWAILRSF